MAASIDENHSTYQMAYKAYVQQKYEDAAELIEAAASSSDPNIHLLRGHIYYVLQQFGTAVDSYKKVLQLTNDPEIASCAQGGLDNIRSYQQSLTSESDSRDSSGQLDFSDFTAALRTGEEELTELGVLSSKASSSFSTNGRGTADNPFDMPTDSTVFASTMDSADTTDSSSNPFQSLSSMDSFDLDESQDGLSTNFELPGIWQTDGDNQSPTDAGDLSFWSQDSQLENNEQSFASENNTDESLNIFAQANITPTNSANN
ncbi:MAG: hypothetical protein HC908_05420, partial [Calothrix sp. SM1_7_51]|nr:hypothetical protein [Calothrix sp. SM1_7_51]